MFNPKTHALTDKSLPSSTPKLYHLQNILFIFENRMSIKFNRHLKAQHKNHTGLFHQFIKFLLLGRTVSFLVFLNMLVFSKDPAKQWDAV